MSNTLNYDLPISESLFRRVDWSKSGAIAYISSDGYSVILQHLLCDPQDGQWKLSQQYVIDDAFTIQHQVDLVHVSWDHGGNVLAIIDAQGRMSIYAAFFTLNRMTIIRRCALDPEDDLGAVIGLMWLHADRPVGKKSSTLPSAYADIARSLTTTSQALRPTGSGILRAHSRK